MAYLKPATRYRDSMFRLLLRSLIEHPQSGAQVACDSGFDFDSETGVLGEICTSLENNKCVEFSVGGFGQDPWPLSVAVDLCVVIEQLPIAYRRIIDGENSFELDFYEQGIERTLLFVGAKTPVVQVGCTCLTSWRPAPPIEYISTQELYGMMAGLGTDFRKLAFSSCTQLAQHPLLDSFWATVDEFQLFVGRAARE